MKRIIFATFFTALFAVLVSCSSQTEEQNVSFSTMSNNTLVELNQFNVALLNKNSSTMLQATRAKNGKRGLTQWEIYQICIQDFIGAAAGMKSVHSIAAAIGAATSGTGYFLTCGIAGGMCSIGFSYKAYKECKGLIHFGTTLPSESPLYITAQKSFIDAGDSLRVDYQKQYKYSHIIEKIHLPQEFSYLRYIGENHNVIIKIALQNDSINNMSSRAIGGGTPPTITPPSQWLPSMGPTKVINTATIANSDALKSVFDKELSQELPIDAKRFIEKNITYPNVKETLKLYLDVYQKYSGNIEEIIKIANNYIDTIERNKDFSNKEKDIIYASLLVSIYSQYLWGE